MKTLFSIIAMLLLYAQMDLKAQVTVSNAHSSSNGNYGTLKAAFDAINAQSQTGNNVTVTITASTTETASASLTGAGGMWTTLTLYPTVSGLSIAGSIGGAPLIDLNGADNVTIDGRVNQSGAKDLTISNTSNANTAQTSTIRLINSAEGNTIKYCIAKGRSTATSNSSIIFISTSTSGNGNDNNTIDNCDITNSGTRPVLGGFLSLGAAGFVNNGNTISNCNFYDIFRATTTTASSMVSVSSFSGGFTISGNSFYEQSTLTASNSNTLTAINVSTSSGNVNITGNYIGGKEALCGGSPMTITASTSLSTIFMGINLSSTSTSVLSNITNNTIKNIDITITNSSTPFAAIVLSSSSYFENCTGNVIGSSTGNSSLDVKSSGSNPISYGIQAAIPSGTANTHNISNNIIGGVTVEGNSIVIAHSFQSIVLSGGHSSSIVNVENNSIGSSSTANSIQALTAANGGNQEVFGIKSSLIGTTYARNNTISNLTNFSTANTSTTLCYGILSWGTGSHEISGNTISNLKTASSQGGTGANSSVFGIANTSTGTSLQNVYGNTIYNFENTWSSGVSALYVTGIYFQGPTAASTSNIYNNFVHSFKISSISTSARITGIEINNSVTEGSGNLTIRNVYNNIVSLGSLANNDCFFSGIHEKESSSRTNNFYFNTVYMGGSPNGNTFTAGLYIQGTGASSVRDVRNNLFVNARSRTGGTGSHYGAIFQNSTGLTADYNNYYTPGTGGTLGYYSGEKTALPIVTGQDANSKNVNPLFSDPDANGTLPGDFQSMSDDLKGAGVTIPGFNTDFSGYTRPSPPSLGGIENDNPLPVNLLSFSGAVKDRDVKLNWVTTYEINNSGFYVERKLNGGIWETAGFIKGKGTASTPSNYEFENKNLNAGKYSYRLKQMDFNGNYEYFLLNEELEVGVPNKFSLEQNYPNPFNPVTNINYSLPLDSKVKLAVYDVAGREVAVVVNEVQKAGYHTVKFNAAGISSGVYFYRLTANSDKGDNSSIKKMVLIR